MFDNANFDRVFNRSRTEIFMRQVSCNYFNCRVKEYPVYN